MRIRAQSLKHAQSTFGKDAVEAVDGLLNVAECFIGRFHKGITIHDIANK